jgi:hypothetical protein
MAKSKRRRRERLGLGPRSIALVRIIFTDKGPDYCDEACVWWLM